MTHWTEEYIGIPFKDKGRDEEGLDCWGLVYLVYLEMFGIELPTYLEDYDTIKNLPLLKRLFVEGAHSGGWVRVLPKQEKMGDVFLLPLAGVRTHVAICVEPGLMLHVTEGIDVCVEEYWSRAWEARMKRAIIYRHPRLTDD